MTRVAGAHTASTHPRSHLVGGGSLNLAPPGSDPVDPAALPEGASGLQMHVLPARLAAGLPSPRTNHQSQGTLTGNATQELCPRIVFHLSSSKRQEDRGTVHRALEAGTWEARACTGPS